MPARWCESPLDGVRESVSGFLDGAGVRVSEAVRVMREKALRRLPITDDGRPVGVVSLGDLAKERDPNSASADISEAPPND